MIQDEKTDVEEPEIIQPVKISRLTVGGPTRTYTKHLLQVTDSDNEKEPEEEVKTDSIEMKSFSGSIGNMKQLEQGSASAPESRVFEHVSPYLLDVNSDPFLVALRT